MPRNATSLDMARDGDDGKQVISTILKYRDTVQAFGKKSNMHNVWDSELIQRRQDPPKVGPRRWWFCFGRVSQ